MRDDDGAVAQERWRERALRGAALEHRYHRFHAAPGAVFARDVDVRRTPASSARRTNSPRPWMPGQ